MTARASQEGTPRTDAEAIDKDYPHEGQYVPADFARTLELENLSLQRRLGEAERVAKLAIEWADKVPAPYREWEFVTKARAYFSPEPKTNPLTKLRTLMANNKIPMLGTIMLQPAGSSHSFAIPDEYAKQLIVEQYGEDHDFVKSYPEWDRATLSVKPGMLTFIEARIAARATLNQGDKGL